MNMVRLTLGALSLHLLAACSTAPQSEAVYRETKVQASQPAGAPSVRDVSQQSEFRVFFDWGSDAITRDGQETLSQAISAASSAGDAAVIVAGHSDRSLEAHASLEQSRRWAQAVADALALGGIARERIKVQAFGEERPLIGTDDGVREIQNRRVEVEIRR